MIDLFYESLCVSVSDWYDENYEGGDLEIKKAVHLDVLKELYSPKMTANMRVYFLTKVQDEVDKRYCG